MALWGVPAVAVWSAGEPQTASVLVISEQTMGYSVLWIILCPSCVAVWRRWGDITMTHNDDRLEYGDTLHSYAPRGWGVMGAGYCVVAGPKPFSPGATGPSARSGIVGGTGVFGESIVGA